jgi:hypothetical protein
MLGRAGSSIDDAAGRPRRGTKRKTTAATITTTAATTTTAAVPAKGSSAERRRNLRNERMATIDYKELVARLTVLVAEKSAPKVTLEEISHLYQRDELRIMLKENGLSYHRPGDRHSNQMQNKNEMAEQLLDIIAQGQIHILKHAAVASVRTSAGPPPKLIKPTTARKRPASTTPDMQPVSSSKGPPVLRLGNPEQLGVASFSEDSTDAEESEVERRAPQRISAPRQQPVFVTTQKTQQRQQQQPVLQPQPKHHPAWNPPQRSNLARLAPVHPQSSSFVRLTAAPSAKAMEDAPFLVDEPPVLIPAEADSTAMTLMSPPMVPNGITDFNERADPSLGCHALGLARRGSFEMVKLSETAWTAARNIPRNCSIQNLTLMEESDKISQGTSWTDGPLDTLMDEGVGGMLRSPSTCQFTMTCP